MRVLMIGDSIICNHSFPNNENAKRYLGVSEFETRHVSTKASYITSFDNVNCYDVIIISSLLNQVSALENRWNAPFDQDKAKDVYELIAEFAKITKDAEKENNTTKFIVLPPTPRIYPKWLADNFESFKKSYLENLRPLTVAEDPPIAETDLRRDGIHLNPMALERYKQYIRDVIHPPDDEYASSPILSQPFGGEAGKQNYTKDEVAEMLGKIYGLMTEDRVKYDRHEKNISLCENAVISISEKVDLNAEKTQLQFSTLQISTAKLKEELDALTNAQRRNILIIRKLEKDSSVVLPEDMPSKSKAVKEFFINKVKSLPVAHHKEFNVRSIFILKTPDSSTLYQDFRLFCVTPADATEIRNRILKARSQTISPWKQIEISNDPVRSTRVRIFLLQAIARKMRPTFDGDVIVNKYSDSPNLILKKNNRTVGQFSFVQAILKHGHLLSVDDVERAKVIAGIMFIGSLKDYFLVIEDTAIPEQIPTPRLSSVSDVVEPRPPESYANTLKKRLHDDAANSRPGNKRRK